MDVAAKPATTKVKVQPLKKLKEMEVSSIETEATLQATTEEKNQLLNDIVEAEKQVMLWERKIQLEKEAGMRPHHNAGATGKDKLHFKDKPTFSKIN